MAIPLFQTISLIFGILLGFMIPAVYQEFELAGSNVSRESNDIGILHRLNMQTPEPQRSAMQNALRHYVVTVVQVEWPLMARSQASPEAEQALNDLWQAQRQIHASDAAHQVVREHIYARLHDLTDHRRNRLLESRTQLGPLMWAMLIGGGLITIGSSWFIRSANTLAQALMVAIMSVMIGFGLLIVMMLDSPFTGSVRVMPDAISDTLLAFPREGPPF